MTSSPVILSGTIASDGTLTLDSPTGLPAGPVSVTLTSNADHHETELWRFFQHINARREMPGRRNRTPEEIAAAIEESRQWDADADDTRGFQQ
jgi:hypothetical protein